VLFHRHALSAPCISIRPLSDRRADAGSKPFGCNYALGRDGVDLHPRFPPHLVLDCQLCKTGNLPLNHIYPLSPIPLPDGGQVNWSVRALCDIPAWAGLC